MAILTIMTLLVVFGILGLLFTLLTNFRPGQKRIQGELKKMKADMDQWAGELVPIKREELELFSLSQVKQLLQKRFTTTGKGIFTTIFEEPILAYSYKKYLGSGPNALLYARSASHEYAYWFKKEGVQVVIDNQLVGTLKTNGVLYGANSKKPLVRINRDEAKLSPVIVKEREVGSVVKALPSGTKDLSQRAFEFIREDITEEEETLLLSVAILELVERTVD